MATGLSHSCLLAAEVFPAHDPLRALSALPGAFALRSSLTDAGCSPRRARWSFFGADPFASFRHADTPAALEAFRQLARDASLAGAAHEHGTPFAGGAVGYWAYDLGRRFESLPEHARDDLKLPDLVLAFYDVVLAHDHDSGRTWAFSSGLPAPAAERAGRARARLEQFRTLL